MGSYSPISQYVPRRAGKPSRLMSNSGLLLPLVKSTSRTSTGTMTGDLSDDFELHTGVRHRPTPPCFPASWMLVQDRRATRVVPGKDAQEQRCRFVPGSSTCDTQRAASRAAAWALRLCSCAPPRESAWATRYFTCAAQQASAWAPRSSTCDAQRAVPREM